ncbi:MAG: amino acid synthesis family protein [Paracoccaceae bacterium]
MPAFNLRKLTLQIEEIHHDGGPAPTSGSTGPRRRAAAVALVSNPFAGRYEEDLQPAMEDLKPLGLMMAGRLIAALGGRAGIDAYGKGALVGAGGELEHGALWHVPGGYAMRELLGESRAIVPSSKKVGGMGATLDVPIGHINAAYVRSHFDAMTVSMPDGPRPDEILFALVMACGGRVHARMGGLAADAIKGEDGLR